MNWTLLTAACKNPDLKEAVEPLREGIASWAKRYKLDEAHWDVDPQWLLNTALYTLEWFERHEPFRENAELLSMWGTQPHLNIEDHEHQYIQSEENVFFKVMKYDPNVFALAGYEKFVKDKVDNAVKEYLKRAERELTKQKWVERPKIEEYYVYEWLVQRHVLGRSFQEIPTDWVESGEWHVQERAMGSQLAEEWDEMRGLDIEEVKLRNAVTNVAKAMGLRRQMWGSG